MVMEIDLRARLMAMIGGVPVDWNLSPQGLPSPRIVLWSISGGADYTLSGASGLRIARVQINCYGADVAASKGLAARVVAAISGWGDGSILVVFLDNANDLPVDTSVPTRVFGVALDFIVHYQQE